MFAAVLLVTGIAGQFLRSTGTVTQAENAPANADDAVLSTKTWTGAGGAFGWTVNGNWSGVGGAQPDDDLVFPQTAAQKLNDNNFPINTNFNSLTFTGTDYHIVDEQIFLANGMTVNVAGAGAMPIFDPNIILGADQTFINQSANSGAFTLNGVVNLNNHNLTVITSCQSCVIQMNGLINGTGTLTKTNPGTLVINSLSSGFGSTNVNAGTLALDGAITSLGTVNLNSGTLRGNGHAEAIVATGGAANGVIDPGTGGTTTGILSATAVTMSATSTFAVDINSANAFDVLHVDGQNIFLNGANLVVRLGNGFTPAAGQQFMIITETGAGILAGQFAQGNSITVNGHRFSITYTSNPGSVVLTALGNAPFDFDGDHKTDISVFRPSTAEWFLSRSTSGFFGAQFGQSTDKVTAADFTGDGKTDIAFFRPSTGSWFVIRSENSTFFAFPFGTNGDIPAAADYDGDGKADAAVYRPSASTWFILRSTNNTVLSAPFGISSDQPVPSDYDGDGKADIAIWRSGPGEWWILKSSNSQVLAAQFGLSTDKPTPGDFTGDGKSDRAFFRPSTGSWFVLRSEDGSFFAFPFGQNGDKPVAGDYDGDGKFDAGVFRPTGANWFVNKSSGGVLSQQFGLATDIPVPGALIP